MDFKSRFKAKISHMTKEGIVGIIAQNSQPITKFQSSNTNLHYKIYANKNSNNESNFYFLLKLIFLEDIDKITLDFTPSLQIKSPSNNVKKMEYLNGNIFKEHSSEELKFRQNYQKSDMKNCRSANVSPISNLSPLLQDQKKSGGLGNLPFLPALNRNEVKIFFIFSKEIR